MWNSYRLGMGDEVYTLPSSDVPPPIRRRRNQVLLLFDAPLYFDWLFWVTVWWAVVSYFAIFTSDSPRGIPAWLDALLAAAFFATIFGILPTWVRLIIRRWRQRRKYKNHIRGFGSTSQSTVASGEVFDRTGLAFIGEAETVPSNTDPVLPFSSLGPQVNVAHTISEDTTDSSASESEAALPKSFAVHWERLDAEGFERLLVRLLEESGAYVRIARLMKLNAADSGRDIQAYRRIGDGMLSERDERMIIQAKHWSKRGINASEIADLVYAKLPLWEGEPVRGLIVATSGSFTQDAVRWVEDHNRAAKRPDIFLWSSSELEMMLRKWPSVLKEFGLEG